MLKQFLEDESAATAIEYGLIIAVLSLAIIGALGTAVNAVHDNFNYLGGIIVNSIE